MTVKTFDQHNLVTLLDPPADQAGAGSSWVSPFADGRGADRAIFMLVTGDVAADVTLTLTQATDSSGTDSKPIPGATLTVPAGNTGAVSTIEIGPGALDNIGDPAEDDGNSDFVWVQATVSTTGTELHTLLYIQHNLRYPGQFSQDATYLSQVRVYD